MQSCVMHLAKLARNLNKKELTAPPRATTQASPLDPGLRPAENTLLAKFVFVMVAATGDDNRLKTNTPRYMSQICLEPQSLQATATV